MMNTCKTCKHFWNPLKDQPKGQCRINEPKASRTGFAQWPWTTNDQWCGKWEQLGTGEA